MAKIREDILLFGGMNLDSAILEKGDYLAAQNCLNSKAKSGNKGEIENVPGNTYVASSYIISSLPGSSHCIGWCHDYENKGIIMFFYNDEGNHCIVRYNIATQEVEKVLFPDPGNKAKETISLNFQPENEVFDAFVIDGKLYWTDNYNPPRKINLEKAYNWSNSVVVANDKTYKTITDKLISQIKSPSLYSPIVNYQNDSNYTRNNLRGSLFQFCYRYIYDDYERTVVSPISKIPLPQGDQYYNGLWVNIPSKNNTIVIQINSGTEDVRKIEIFTRIVNTQTGGSVVYGNFYLIHEIDKFNEYGQQIVDDNITYTHIFKNDVPKQFIDQSELLRPFDYVPQLSGSMCVIDGNKIIHGNYLEGYNPISLDVYVETFKSLINFSIGSVTLDTVNSVVYIVEAEYLLAQTLGGNLGYYYGKITLPGNAPIAGQSLELFVREGNNICSTIYIIQASDVANYPTSLADKIKAILQQNNIEFPNPAHVSVLDKTNPYVITVFKDKEDTDTVSNLINNAEWIAAVNGWSISAILQTFNTVKSTSFKKGSRAKFGIIYKDAYKRSSAILTNENLEIEIPTVEYGADPNSIYKYGIAIYINHLAPEWATSYSIVWFPKNTILSFFQFIYRVNTIDPENTYDIRKDVETSHIRIRVNTAIKSHNEKTVKSIIPEYIWTKKDRIRFIARIDGLGNMEYLSEELDYEIIGAEEYTDDEEVFYEIILEDFSPETYGLYNDGNTTLCEWGVVYEIYTPAYDYEEKIGYEIDHEHPIVNRYHLSRYSGINVNQTATNPARIDIGGEGDHFGDCYIFNRSILYNFTPINIPVESMHFSDFYQSDVYTLGLPGVVSDTIRQKRYTSGLRYSNSLVQESQINGLSTIEYSSYHILNESFGRIMKMEQVGDAIKIRQELKSTSFYVGKSFLKTATGQNVPVEAQDRVLGAKVVSNDSYGLAHPYSYVVYNRHEYFFDVRNGVVIRDSANGMFEISGYGMQSFFKELGALIYNNPSIYRIRAGYDTLNDMYILLIHNISNRIKPVPYILAFHEKTNKWKTFLTHYYKTYLLSYESPQMYAFFGDVMLSARDEGIWRHNEGTNNTFYGQFNPSFITVRSQAEFDKAKTFESIGVNSNKYWYAPSFDDIQIDPTITYPRGMRSRLKQGKFTHKEGMLWAAFMNNAVTHQATPTEEDLVNGDNLRGRTMDIKLWNYDTEDVSLLNIVVMSNPSGML
jgi:hypothetical protein